MLLFAYQSYKNAYLSTIKRRLLIDKIIHHVINVKTSIEEYPPPYKDILILYYNDNSNPEHKRATLSLLFSVHPIKNLYFTTKVYLYTPPPIPHTVKRKK